MKLLSVLLVTCSLSFATNVTFTGNDVAKTLSDKGLSLPIYKKATLNYNGTSYDVYPTGGGLRQKSEVFWFDIYLAASYTDLPNGLSQMSSSTVTSAQSLSELRPSKARVLQLMLVRKLDQGTARTSFEEGLVRNLGEKILSSAAIKKVLDGITADLEKGTLVTIVGLSDGKSESANETIYADFGTGPIESAGTDVAWEFWNVWFGNPGDDAGMANLKVNLTTKP